MIESEIEILISCLDEYFFKKSEQSAIIETPYLVDSIQESILDFTGIITISGSYLGNVYFTATHAFSERLISAHDQYDFSDSLKQDVVGEVVNTLAGNSRKHLGNNFVISVPQWIDNSELYEKHISHEAHDYIIPIVWSGERASMIVSIVRAV